MITHSYIYDKIQMQRVKPRHCNYIKAPRQKQFTYVQNIPSSQYVSLSMCVKFNMNLVTGRAKLNSKCQGKTLTLQNYVLQEYTNKIANNLQLGQMLSNFSFDIFIFLDYLYVCYNGNITLNILNIIYTYFCLDIVEDSFGFSHNIQEY